jgi:hypothetical protein
MIDLLVAGLAIGGGTKPLHNVISGVQRSRPARETPARHGIFQDHGELHPGSQSAKRQTLSNAKRSQRHQRQMSTCLLHHCPCASRTEAPAP